MDDMRKTPGQQRRDELLAEIDRVETRVIEYNSHWMNHKHAMSVVGVVVMALIFTSMLIPALEVYLWAACGAVVISVVILMVIRQREAKRLNEEMEAARTAFKDYERSRRR